MLPRRSKAQVAQIMVHVPSCAFPHESGQFKTYMHMCMRMQLCINWRKCIELSRSPHAAEERLNCKLISFKYPQGPKNEPAKHGWIGSLHLHVHKSIPVLKGPQHAEPLISIGLRVHTCILAIDNKHVSHFIYYALLDTCMF